VSGNRFRNLFRRKELNHQDIQSLTSDYVEGALDESISTNFRSQRNGFANCNSFVATFRATVLTRGALPRRPVQTDLHAKVQQRIQSESSKQEADENSSN
jgi:hypothetical protein